MVKTKKNYFRLNAINSRDKKDYSLSTKDSPLLLQKLRQSEVPKHIFSRNLAKKAPLICIYSYVYIVMCISMYIFMFILLTGYLIQKNSMFILQYFQVLA